MATINTNGVSLEVYESTPIEQKATMNQVARVLVEMATWSKPAYVTRKVKMTKEYYREDFEVCDLSNDNDTMVHLIRRIQNGVMETILATKHIFSVSDYEKYEKKPTDKLTPSDSELFGINLIKRWGEYNKVAREILTSM